MKPSDFVKIHVVSYDDPEAIEKNILDIIWKYPKQYEFDDNDHIKGVLRFESESGLVFLEAFVIWGDHDKQKGAVSFQNYEEVEDATYPVASDKPHLAFFRDEIPLKVCLVLTCLFHKSL